MGSVARVTEFPPSWGLPRAPSGVTWLRHDLQTRQLQAVPQLRDGGSPKGSVSVGLPEDVIEDDAAGAPRRPETSPPAGAYAVSYTHLTLPTKRIV